ncbi:MAG: hypothetical protein ACUVRZ_09895, partial [Desulfobacca sp.]
IYYLLHELSTEFLLYMMAKTRQESTKRAISLYFTQLKNTRPLLTGKDLQQLGYEAGPRYRFMLQKLLEAHLDGLVRTKEEEIAFLREHFAGQGSEAVGTEDLQQESRSRGVG